MITKKNIPAVISGAAAVVAGAVAMKLAINHPAPNSALVGYRGPHEYFNPPIVPSNAPNGFIMQYSFDLHKWTDVLSSNIPDGYIVAVSNESWIVYSSNFTTHALTPVQTNVRPGVTWDLHFTNKPSQVFFRYKVL